MNSGADHCPWSVPSAIGGLVILLVSGYFGYALLASQFTQSHANATFEPVSAEVLASEVRSSKAPDIRTARSWRVAIRYRYSVDGRDYVSDRYAFISQGWSSQEAAEAVAAHYPAGARITAYRDPQRPGDAMLIKHSLGVPAWALALPFGLLMVFGLLLSVHGLRSSGLSTRR